MPAVVTTLTIDARAAASGSATYSTAMAKAEAATQRLVDVNQKAQASIDKGVGAVLGPATSSSRLAQQVDRLKASYDQQFAAQQRIDRAQRTTDQAVARGILTQREAAEVVDRVRQRQDALVRSTQSMGRASAIATGQVGLARHELTNLGRQVQDVGTMLAMGASPMSILASQGAQVFDIFSSTRASMADVRAQLLGFITPTRALGLGLVAIAGGAAAATVSWKNYALALDDVARSAGVSSAEMAKLQAAAGFKGIGQDDFNAAMSTFSRGVYEARHNMGQLAEVFRANGVRARDVNQALERAADLIRNATSDQERLVLLQQMGLPPTMAWVRLLGGGAEGIRRAREEAAAFGGEANDKMVRRAREFDEAWNKAWTNFGLASRNAVVIAADGLEQLANTRIGRAMLSGGGWLLGSGLIRSGVNAVAPAAPQPTPAQTVASRFPGAGEFDPAAATRNIELERRQLQLLQQRISTLGQLATVEMQVSAARAQIASARLSGVQITLEEQRAIENLTRVQAESQRMNERATLGLFDVAAAQAQVNRELQAAIDRGLLDPAKPDQMAIAYGALSRRMKEMAEAATVAASAMPQLTRYAVDAANVQKGLDQALAGGMRSIEDNLASIVTGTKSVSAAFRDMVNSILSDLLKLLIRQNLTGPLAGLLGGMMGGAGGGKYGGYAQGVMTRGYHTGGIAGVDGTPRYVHPAVFEGAQRYHGGGIAGLARDEVPAILRRGEPVFRSFEHARQVVGGSNVSVQPVLSVRVENHGPSQPEIRQSDDGLSLEVIIPKLEEALAARMSRGRGSLGKTTQSVARNQHRRG